MSDLSKLTRITQTWLDFFYLENLAHAEVDAGDDDNKIEDSKVSLVGNNLLIQESLFKQLKQQFLELKNKGKSDEFQMAVALPQIWRVMEGTRRLRPPFKIDISSIFQGNYRTKGWDLNAFEFQPVPPILMELYQLDEEEIEALVTREGLKVFLETTFKQSFNSLQEFLDLIDLPPHPYKTKRSPYLLRFDYVAYNHNLKKDLQKILDSPRWEWAKPGHPAYEYLFGQPQPPKHEQMFLGAFPTGKPDEFQATILKHTTLANPITAVIGSPASGKTTLLLHTIATQVTGRAVEKASTGEDKSNLTVVTSTNNQAIQNVEERLALFSTSQFYLSGGKKELINQSTIPKLQAAIDWLRSTAFSHHNFEQIRQQILALVTQLQQHQQQDRCTMQQRADDEQLLEQLSVDIQGLNQGIEDLQADSRSVQQQLESRGDYSEFPLETYKQIQKALAPAWRSLPKTHNRTMNRSRHWLHRVRRFWYGTLDNFHFLLLYFKIRKAVLATKETPFAVEMPLSRHRLNLVLSIVSSQLEAAQNWQQLQQNLAHTQNQLAAQQQQRFDLVMQLAQVEERLASYPSVDFYTRFYSDYHELQQQLFELSWQFLQMEAWRRKDEVIVSLETYIGVLIGEWDAKRHLAREWSNIYRDLSLLFPVITSTLHSIRNMLPYPDSGCIDRLIVDEAGMISCHQLFPALVRCRQALVVGDPLQLEPVISFSDQTLKHYYQTAFIERGLSDLDYDLYSPTAKDTATAIHRAAGASGRIGDSGQAIILRNHYRCLPPIIAFCNPFYDNQLVIKTKSIETELGDCLIAYHVQGRCVQGSYQSHVNLEEIDCIEAIIEQLKEKVGASSTEPQLEPTIGVISPYRQQSYTLQQRLTSLWKEFRNSDIGTIHNFQGSEKDIIILSTRQCHPQHHLDFINRKPNLLNVAVSRAKKQFILVGNLERLKAAKGYTLRLVEHIEQYGVVRELPH